MRSAVAPISARVLGFWLVFWLVLGALLPLFFGVSVLAQAGHIGGLVVGCVVGWGMSRRPEQRFSRYASGAVTIVGLLGLGVASIAPTWRPNYDLFVGVELLDSGHPDQAIEYLERVLAEDPEDPSRANNIAYSLAEAGVELERAEELVRGALEVDPDPNFLDTLGWIQCKRGQVQEGEFNLRLANALAEEEIPDVTEHLEGCAEAGGR
ncbi:hypothetical protein ENSA5_06520 [Enhygromyxa salina]|uniref:Uncharacterized protein n=1 Tax=Enhygromyxa salina TaxID=215803 RepID=A0A2S9YHI0_9BACT|nr:hypothetical protein ENSA5_06520 [Enhygromyxa salina]